MLVLTIVHGYQLSADQRAACLACQAREYGFCISEAQCAIPRGGEERVCQHAHDHIAASAEQAVMWCERYGDQLLHHDCNEIFTVDEESFGIGRCAGAQKVVQVVTASSLTAAEYTGNTKKAYELGYGTALGIVTIEDGAATYKTGCLVTSTGARRSLQIEFTAVVPANSPVASVDSTSLASGITQVTVGDTSISGVDAPASSQLMLTAATVATLAHPEWEGEGEGEGGSCLCGETEFYPARQVPDWSEGRLCGTELFWACASDRTAEQEDGRNHLQDHCCGTMPFPGKGCPAGSRGPGCCWGKEADWCAKNYHEESCCENNACGDDDCCVDATNSECEAVGGGAEGAIVVAIFGVLCCCGIAGFACFMLYQAQQRQPHPHMAAGVVAGTGPGVFTAPPVYPATHLPPGWTAAQDPQGRTYYCNSTTQATQWEHPGTVPPMAVVQPAEAPLPVGWTTAQDHKGATYYYNTSTQATQWERPGGTAGVPGKEV